MNFQMTFCVINLTIFIFTYSIILKYIIAYQTMELITWGLELYYKTVNFRYQFVAMTSGFIGSIITGKKDIVICLKNFFIQILVFKV